MKYMITGEYPKEEQFDNDFRNDLKVLELGLPLREAREKFVKYAEQGFGLLRIRSYRDEDVHV